MIRAGCWDCGAWCDGIELLDHPDSRLGKRMGPFETWHDS